MKPCAHYHAIIGRKAAMNPVVLASEFALPRVAMIYQEQPTTAKGQPIWPHRWNGGFTLGGDWTGTDPEQAAIDTAEWLRRTMPGASGPIVLNVESIALDTPEADAFWSAVLPAMKRTLPRATFGFYNRPYLGHLVDFYAPSIYPIKRINAQCWADGEHEQTPAFYRQATYRNLAQFDRKLPWLVYATCTVGDRDAQWASVLEVQEQWRLAQDLGADVVWWGSCADEADVRRARKLLTWIAMSRAASSVL